MEKSLPIDSSAPNSHHNRSRSSSYLSSTAQDFEGLNIQNLSRANEEESSTSSNIPSSLEEAFSPETLISAPAPAQQLTPYSHLSQDEFHTNWFYISATRETSRFRLQLNPASAQGIDQKSTRPNSNPADMSTIGIQQFDHRFDHGHGLHNGLRHTYTWPQLELHDQFFSQNQLPTQTSVSPAQITPNLFEEPKQLMSPPNYSRSVTSSPPKAILTPEQRELKRQRDHARRESKTLARVGRERSTSNTSNPYVVPQHTSPELVPKSVPEYQNSLTPSPLLSQGSLHSSPALGSADLLPSFPQVNEQVPSDIYTSVFSMSPNDFTSTPTFPMSYSNGPADASLQSIIGGRSYSHSLSSIPDHSHSSMYRTQMNPKGLDSNSGSGDHVRVVHSRPKPQCWEHGCNGRQFSTFSNLLRHQREKSGAAQKSSCPNCGAEFTRTTARNGHMAHDKCKQRRNS